MRVALLLFLLAALVAWGIAIDRSEALTQNLLFTALQVASLGGAGLGAAFAASRFRSSAVIVLLGVLALLAWRISYFPIMVFSGHVASVGEWIQLATSFPVAVYPIFFCSVVLLHALAASAASWLLKPPHPAMYAALVPAFAVAITVSFSQPSDWTWLPDRTWALEDQVPKPRAEEGNPYLPALAQPGYAVQQRVMLAAAGVTYATIPPSPWATTVKAVLEGLFHENPVASTGDRVREHYLAYHSAHGFIGCTSYHDCPLEFAAAEDEAAGEAVQEPADAEPEDIEEDPRWP